MTGHELEYRLREWADEYRGSRYEDLGYPSRSWLHKAIVYQGPAPQGLNPRGIQTNTPADEVESALRVLMRQVEGNRPANVLRAEYFMRTAAEQHKLDALKALGLPMSRHTYYRALQIAKVHVAASIGVCFSHLAEDVA